MVTEFACDRCRQHKDGIPFGPINATWCWDCWQEWQREEEREAVEMTLLACGESLRPTERWGDTFASALQTATGNLMLMGPAADYCDEIAKISYVIDELESARSAFRLPTRISI